MLWWLRAEGNAQDEEGTLGGGYADVDYSDGMVGQGFELNGSDQYLAFDPLPSMYVAGSFSIEGWILAESDGYVVSLYECGWYCPTALANSSYGLSVFEGNVVGSFRPSDEEVTTIRVASTVDVTDGTWHHVVLSRDVESLVARLWVDGVLEASQTLDAAETGRFEDLDGEDDPFNVGASRVAGSTEGEMNYLLQGRLDELTFFTGALNTEEVGLLYAAGDAGKCTD